MCWPATATRTSFCRREWRGFCRARKPSSLRHFSGRFPATIGFEPRLNCWPNTRPSLGDFMRQPTSAPSLHRPAHAYRELSLRAACALGERKSRLVLLLVSRKPHHRVFRAITLGKPHDIHDDDNRQKHGDGDRYNPAHALLLDLASGAGTRRRSPRRMALSFASSRTSYELVLGDNDRTARPPCARDIPVHSHPPTEGGG